MGISKEIWNAASLPYSDLDHLSIKPGGRDRREANVEVARSRRGEATSIVLLSSVINDEVEIGSLHGDSNVMPVLV